MSSTRCLIPGRVVRLGPSSRWQEWYRLALPPKFAKSFPPLTVHGSSGESSSPPWLEKFPDDRYCVPQIRPDPCARDECVSPASSINLRPIPLFSRRDDAPPQPSRRGGTAYAEDLKSSGGQPPCGFESHRRHQSSSSLSIKRMDRCFRSETCLPTVMARHVTQRLPVAPR